MVGLSVKEHNLQVLTWSCFNRWGIYLVQHEEAAIDDRWRDGSNEQ